MEPTIEYQEMRVVSADELSSLTKEGWRLVQVLAESKCTTACEQIPIMNPGGYVQTTGAMKSHVIAEHVFLVGLPGSVDNAKTAEILQLRVDLAAQKLLELDLRAKETAATMRAANMEAEAKEAGASWTRALTDRDAERQKRLLMERDFAKLRDALGTVKVKEILG